MATKELLRIRSAIEATLSGAVDTSERDDSATYALLTEELLAELGASTAGELADS